MPFSPSDGDIILASFCAPCNRWHCAPRVRMSLVTPAPGHESPLIDEYLSQDARFSLVMDPTISTSQALQMAPDGMGEEVAMAAIQLVIHIDRHGGVMVEMSDPIFIRNLICHLQALGHDIWPEVFPNAHAE